MIAPNDNKLTTETVLNSLRTALSGDFVAVAISLGVAGAIQAGDPGVAIEESSEVEKTSV